jgi:hypothetical protein
MRVIPKRPCLVRIECIPERISRGDGTLGDAIRAIHEVRSALEHAVPMLCITFVSDFLRARHIYTYDAGSKDQARVVELIDDVH